jgi:hypothetical protein
LQDTIIERIIALSGYAIERDEIFKRGYLNFEADYRANGWIVTYHKPERDENFKTFFSFIKKDNK